MEKISKQLMSIIKENKELQNASLIGIYLKKIMPEKYDQLVSSITFDSFLIDVLKFVENSIPEDNRETFYNNLKTLKFNIKSRDMEYNGGDVSARYIPENNEVCLNDEDMLSVFKRVKNIDEVFALLEITIAHELFHMASTLYSEEQGEIKVGFKIKENTICNGITEGYTQLLASKMHEEVYNKYIAADYYNLIVSLVGQLSLIVGKSTMDKGYFGTEGIKCIIDKLEEINPDNSGEKVIIDINMSYIFETIDGSVLEFVQGGLLDYLTKILEESQISNKEKWELISKYDKYFINEKSLIKRRKDPKKYMKRIEKSSSKFELLKLKYELRSQYRNLEDNDTLKR